MTVVTTIAVVGSAGPLWAAPVTASVGHVDSVTTNRALRTVTVRGWAFDPRAPLARAAMHVRIDGRAYHDYLTGLARPDVRRAHPTTTGNTGFSITTGSLSYGRHSLCISRLPARGGSAASVIGCALVIFPSPVTVNTKIANYAKTFVGRYPYRSGGTSPATGFDCSGLTSYVYRVNGRPIARSADQQYRQFRRIAKAQTRPGDLIFFHSGGSTFHVGVYEGGNSMVAAATPSDGIRFQSYLWWPNVTFGTITH